MGKANLLVGEGTVLMKTGQNAAASATFTEAGNTYGELVSRCAKYFQSDPTIEKYFRAAIDLEGKARGAALGTIRLDKAKK